MSKSIFTLCLYTDKQVFWNSPFLSIYADFKVRCFGSIPVCGISEKWKEVLRNQHFLSFLFFNNGYKWVQSL